MPFGKGKKVAFLVECTLHSEHDTGKLKRVERILDDEPLLSTQDLQLLYWASRYYHHPLGEVISAAFPVALRQGKSVLVQTEKIYVLTEPGKTTDSNQLKRTPKQKIILEKFQSLGFETPPRHSLSEAELSAWNTNWRSSVRQLIAKGLVAG